ncbi:MAG: long-chain fatty acid--CoA ligase [Chloroflexi bacterium]|nr:long-chain fatty acid--CoA ligase [Chloroflexota bacterium]
MLSTMMDVSLTIQHILWRIENLYPGKPIVTQRAEGAPARSTYGELSSRARRLADALARFGIKPGDRVATFAWNTQRHLECYFAVPCMGAVLHTVNVRLFPEQSEYIINHAEDRVIFCDRSVLPALEKLAHKLPLVELVVLMNEGPEATGAFPNTVDYEDFLSSGDPSFRWPQVDERWAAAMCYTSGTTGRPKGIVYSHRSMVLHTLAAGLPNAVGLLEGDVVMYAVPMFHANAWGFPYLAATVGAAQVFSDRFLDAERLIELLDREGVTVSAGVPTLWVPVLNVLNTTARKLPKLHRILCGGSSVPPSLISGFQRHGIQMVQGWGMTETSPLGSVSRLKAAMEAWPDDKKLAVLSKQGVIVPTVECRIVDLESGKELPWDSASFGELQVRGPYITGSYYRDPEGQEKFMDGWLRTGDVATIDPEGYIHLVDRTKDLVKSGGEWISSIDLENAIMAHPKVLEAAVVGLPHPHWQERPVAVVVPKPEYRGQLDAEEVRDFLAQRVARWWLPDEIVIMDQIPKTSVGKFAKTVLREQLAWVAQRWANVQPEAPR